MRYARVLVVGFFVLVVALGCSSEQQGGSAGQTSEEGGNTTSQESQQQTTAQNGGQPQTTEEQAGQRSPSQPARQGVRLRLGGEEGTRFSGSCTVAGERRRIEGQTPKSYSFKPEGGPVACNIKKQGPGGLKVVFASDGQRSVQTVSGQSATLKLRYNNGGLSSRVQSATQKATQSSGGQKAKQEAKQKVEQFSGGGY